MDLENILDSGIDGPKEYSKRLADDDCDEPASPEGRDYSSTPTKNRKALLRFLLQIPRPRSLVWKLVTPPSEPTSRAKPPLQRRGKVRPLRLPAKPRLLRLDLCQEARHPSEAIPEDPVAADKTFIFCSLEQMIIAADLQSLEGVSPTYLLQLAAYHNFQAQLFQVGLYNAIKGLAKDSELLKSAKAAHSKEVKSLKVDVAKLSAKLAEALEGFTIVSETLKSALENVLKEFKASEDFHEEAMAHAEMHARTIVDKWLEGEVGKRYLLNLGEADYDMEYQDAHKEIFELLKARDTTFSSTRWGLLNPVTPDNNQAAEDATLNASVDTVGGEIPMDDVYLNSPANLNSVARMGRASILTLVEDGQGDAAATEEEDPSAALQLNCRALEALSAICLLDHRRWMRTESLSPRPEGCNRSLAYLVAL
nr:MAP7 domain-containing protein 1-like [Ipomoea batatas]GMC70895.1 MAP7 domain-containing protein 1-like [Ipomoea batatas]